MGFYRKTIIEDNRLRMVVHRINESYNSNNKVVDKLSTGQWRGKRCFIIGGGPSIKEQKLDLSLLQDECVIGINRSYEYYGDIIDILYMMDVRYIMLINERKIDEYKKEKEGVTGAYEAFQKFKGIKVFLTPMSVQKFPPDVYVVRTRIDKSLSTRLEDGIYGGTNSGFGAIQLAMCLGANPIYLLGYDMKISNGRSHWHSGYPKQDVTTLKDRLAGYRYEMELYAPEMKRLGFDIVNLNYDSALRCFRFAKYEDVIKDKRPVAISITPPYIPEKNQVKKHDTVFVESYLGFGDQLNMRPFVIALTKIYRKVYLTTPFPELYWKKPKNLYFVKPHTRLRLQKKNIERQPEGIWSPRPTSGFDFKKPDYGLGLNIIEQLGRTIIETKIDYSFEPNPKWLEDARKLVPDTKGKKLCVIKPPTIREEWKVETRLPRLEYMQLLVDRFKDMYYFVTVADIEPGVDEYYGGKLRGIDKEFDKIDIWTTVGLFAISDMAIGFPSFFIPLLIQLKKKAFCIFGGYNKPENYLHSCMDLSKFAYVAPNPMCNCLRHFHNCNKIISQEELLNKFTELIRR